MRPHLVRRARPASGRRRATPTRSSWRRGRSDSRPTSRIAPTVPPSRSQPPGRAGRLGGARGPGSACAVAGAREHCCEPDPQGNHPGCNGNGRGHKDPRDIWPVCTSQLVLLGSPWHRPRTRERLPPGSPFFTDRAPLPAPRDPVARRALALVRLPARPDAGSHRLALRRRWSGRGRWPRRGRRRRQRRCRWQRRRGRRSRRGGRSWW